MHIKNILPAIALGVAAFFASGTARATSAPLGPSNFADGVLRYGTYQGSGIRSDIFTIPAGGAELTVDYKFLTSEFDPADLNTGQNDYALFGLFDPTQQIITPMTGVDPATRGVLDPNTGLVPIGTPYVSPRGDGFTYESSAIQLLLDVPPELAGKSAYVLFAVFDSGDGFMPTGALIGSFSQPVPGAYFSPDISAFLGTTGKTSGYMNMVLTSDLPAGVTLDGFNGNLPLLSTGGIPLPEPASLAALALGVGGILMRRSRRMRQ